MRLLRAEVRKLLTVRSAPLLLVAALLVEVAFKVLLAGLQDVGRIDSRPDQIAALAPTLILPLAAAAIGVLVAGAEWRHRLAVGSFLVTPRRLPVLAAQAAVAALAGTAVGFAAAGTANALIGVVLDARTTLRVDAGAGWVTVAGTAAASGLLAAGGVGVAALLRSQAAALGAVTVLLFVLAPLTQVLAPEVAAYLPGGAVQGLALQRQAEPAYLPVPAAGALLAAQVAVTLALAARVLRRLDVT
jgi:hypothetical protein